MAKNKLPLANAVASSNALKMVDAFPSAEDFQGAEFAAVFDALTACMSTLSGIQAEPRCNYGYQANSAGSYLEAIYNFLSEERRRMMLQAGQVTDDDRDDGNHERLRALLCFLAEDADLSFSQKLNLIAEIQRADRSAVENEGD